MLQIVAMKLRLMFTAALLCCVCITHGDEQLFGFVRGAKTLPADRRLNSNGDIKKISGATLSCRHITDGVKRVLASYEIALRH